MPHKIASPNLRRSRCFLALLAAVGAPLGDSALAQVTPDGTLGPESSQVLINGVTVDQAAADLIRGGAQREGNLFHSFEQFSIDEGQGVYFDNPAGVERIFSRVTGPLSSDIFGTLGVDGGADLFLLNPNGIVFGPNARLDVNGSLTASTAESVMFSDGSEFSAIAPETSLLTINVPLGVQFNAPAQGAIVNQGNLEGGTGATLSLYGSSIESSGRLEARGGGDIILVTPQTLGNSVIIDGGWVVTDVERGATTEGGDIRITTHNLTVQNDASVSASTFGEGDSGRVDITARNDVMVDGSLIVSLVGPEAIGDSGGIVMTTNNLSVLNGAAVSASTFGDGDAGRVDITAQNEVTVDGDGSGIASQVGPEAIGDSGGIVMTTHNLSVLNDASVSAGTFGDGDAGRVDITAQNEVTVDGDGSGIASVVGSGAIGDSGGIVMTTNNLSVLNGAAVSASTFGDGDAGRVDITAQNEVTVDGDGSVLGSVVAPGAIGDSGGVVMTTHNLSVLNDAAVGASTGGEGNAGRVDIIAQNEVTVDGDGSFIASEVRPGAIGDSGGVVMTTNNLSVLNNARVSASTFGDGDAGQVDITARNDVMVDGSGIVSEVGPGAIGDSGGVVMTTNNLSVLNDASVSASTGGEGNAGRVDITARNEVTVDGDGSFIVSLVAPEAIGNSGGIVMTTHNLAVLNDAAVGASTLGEGDSGRVDITARNDVMVDGSFIGSEVGRDAIGDSGGVVMTTNNLSVLNDASVSASTFGDGDAGRVDITARNDVTVDGDGSVLGSEVRPDAIGDSGGVVMTTNNLSVLNDARVSASTGGEGNAGRVDITAQNEVTVDGDGSGIGSAVGSEAIGDSGGVVMTTNNLSVLNDAAVSASTFGDGNAGPVQIEASAINLGSENSEISAETHSRGTGGGVRLSSPNTLTIDGPGRITVETNETGSAGNIGVEAERLTLDNGVTLSASTTGPILGGSISVTADETTLRNGSQIVVDSEGAGPGGNVTLTGDLLTLADNSRISASTLSSNGGNVTLNLQDLLVLRNGSEITTTAGTAEAGGNGGDITIDTQFIVAVAAENSDITANAFDGDGGNVNITATGGIFGIAPRPERTPQSDITASSRNGVSGNITVQSPEVDPNQGAIELPVDPITSDVAQSCREAYVQSGSEFIVTGRGGLPQGPLDSMPTVLWQDILPIEDSEDDAQAVPEAVSHPTINNSDATPPTPIVEIQGWIKNEHGEIELVAEVPPLVAIGQPIECQR